MSRLIIATVVIAVTVTVYAVIDCAMSDATRVRALKKPTWLVVILLVPLVGPILWILFGKGLLLKPVAEPTSSAPDDDETFLRSIGIDDGHDETIRRLEDELRALDEESDEPRKRDTEDDHETGDQDGHHTPGTRPDSGDEPSGTGGSSRA